MDDFCPDDEFVEDEFEDGYIITEGPDWVSVMEELDGDL